MARHPNPVRFRKMETMIQSQEPQSAVTTNGEYAQKWQEMRRIAHRLVLAYLIGPVGFFIYDFFAGKSWPT